ncbi:replicative DNA helicase [Candidatus Gracilibacteria bacterium]|nr:replicative DNA helicase [Candidatus Gracilibacteria bacterium]
MSSDEKKIAPQAIEAEKSVLGCLLLDKDAAIKIADFLNPDDFYHDHHRFIYQSILDLFFRSEPIDLITVSTKLEGQKKLELIGGPEYLAKLQNIVPVATHIFKYAQSVKHRSTLRKLIKTGNSIVSLGYETEKPIEELLESAEKSIFSISQTFLKNRFINIKEILESSYEKFCEIHENPELANANRIKSHFKSLDSQLNGGFSSSDLVILAARPSMGKTALSLAICQNAAIQSGKRIGVISLEMSKEQLVERMFCGLLGVDSWKLHKGKLTEEDFERMGPVMDQLATAPFFIDDTMGSSISELRAKVRRLQMEHGIDMLMIDYLQLMSGGNPMNRVQEISEISRSLKELAREMNIPIIALSQLSRSVESRPNKRPVLSDLRDSGSIEQDADIVMMLYREDYYDEDCDESDKNTLEVNILKHRNGPIGRVKLFFDRSRMKFADLDKNHQAGF